MSHRSVLSVACAGLITAACAGAAVGQNAPIAPFQRAQTAPAAQGQRATSIDWASARRDQATQQRATQGRAAGQRAVPQPRNAAAGDLAAVRLPVLIPAIPGAETTLVSGQPGMLLFPRQNFYAASMAVDGVAVEVFGTRLVNAVIADPAATRRLQAGRDAEGFIVTRTETGQIVDFSRYGAAYSITLECDDPEADPRCTDPEFVRNVARSLQIAGGEPEGGQ